MDIIIKMSKIALRLIVRPEIAHPVVLSIFIGSSAHLGFDFLADDSKTLTQVTGIFVLQTTGSTHYQLV